MKPNGAMNVLTSRHSLHDAFAVPTGDLEAHKDCVYDRVEIYDGAVADPNNLISKLCGQVRDVLEVCSHLLIYFVQSYEYFVVA
uniref:CUB domain-containing protein n=1 Tax=Parascaris equorum TaxID=6256 RepID=A0A914RYG4_PAREQ